METKMWVEYHHSSMSADICGIWRGTEEQIVQKFKEDYGEEDLDYEMLMDREWQGEMDFTLEEVNENLIQDL